MRFMVGHLLLPSSASEIARKTPTIEPLILKRLERCKTPKIVVTRTRCGPPDTNRRRPMVQPRSGGRMQPAAQAVGGKQRGRASPGGAKENWAALKYS